MTRQTKLDIGEKQVLKTLLKEFKDRYNGQVFEYPVKGVTVAIAQEFNGSDMLRAAIAIASPTETKYRRKVGQYLSVCRWFDRTVHNVISIPACSYDSLERAADNIAMMINGQKL